MEEKKNNNNALATKRTIHDDDNDDEQNQNEHSKGKIVPLRHLSGLDTSSETRTRKARR